MEDKDIRRRGGWDVARVNLRRVGVVVGMGLGLRETKVGVSASGRRERTATG